MLYVMFQPKQNVGGTGDCCELVRREAVTTADLPAYKSDTGCGQVVLRDAFSKMGTFTSCSVFRQS